MPNAPIDIMLVALKELQDAVRAVQNETRWCYVSYVLACNDIGRVRDLILDLS